MMDDDHDDDDLSLMLALVLHSITRPGLYNVMGSAAVSLPASASHSPACKACGGCLSFLPSLCDPPYLYILSIPSTIRTEFPCSSCMWYI